MTDLTPLSHSASTRPEPITRRRLGMAAVAAGVGATTARLGMPAAAQEATPAATTPSGPGWEVPAKWLGVPDTVSPVIAPVIGKPPGAVWLRRVPVDQLRAALAVAAEQGAKNAEALWQELGLTVEETTVAGVPCRRITPPDVPAENANRLLVHTHGGAYVFNGGAGGSIEGSFVAHAARMPVVSIDYRMPPDHPFPAALDDALAVWTELTKEHAPGRTGLFGTSAGGGLAMATTLKLAEQGMPGPAALSLSTPWSDLSKSGDTYVTNAMVDNVIVTWDGLLGESAELYAAGEDLRHPFVSPVYGDLSGFPPTLLLSGTRDLFLSNTVRVHTKLRQANVPADLLVFEAMPHAGWTPWDNPIEMARNPAPETTLALAEIARHFDRHLAR